jgi:hypothetical protein
MRRVAVLLLVLASGCSHYVVSASSGASASPAPAPRGTVVTGGTSGLQVNAIGSSATVLLISMTAASAITMAAQPAPAQPDYFRSWSEVSDWFSSRPAPGMALDRKVAEQDCSKPIDLTAGNLRCR